MKKPAIAALLLVFIVLSSCREAGFDPHRYINVVSREDGSGTRGAFIALMGIELLGEGTRKDLTTKEAVIAKQTDVMMTNITRDKYGIGYISLGSMNASVKGLTVDGVAPTPDSVKRGDYPVARPFNIAFGQNPTENAKDFIDFIMSREGQAVVSQMYISVDDDAPAYAGSPPGGKVTVAGSSSVAPVMEKLREAYTAINPGVTVEVQMSDSSAGTQAVLDGTCDIGMASRSLKESELERLSPVQIALDGIVIIVNNENPLTGLTKSQIFDIFTGKTQRWEDVE